MPKYRLLFFTSRLGGGGAEMHLVRLINHLDPAEFDVEVALARPGGPYEPRLRPGVAVHHLNEPNVQSSTVSLIRSVGPLRTLIDGRQPDLLFSVLDHSNLVAIQASVKARHRPKVIVSVQNTLTTRGNSSFARQLQIALIPYFYRKANSIVALSSGVAGDLKKRLPRVKDLQVIHNAGWDRDVLRLASEPIEHVGGDGSLQTIVACGRLTQQKAYPILLEAFSHVVKRRPARLLILGEGPLRDHLEKLADRLGLSEHVRFLGFQKNPFRFMSRADLFVLSSLWEGFGNVIVEAMACGTPVVATDCTHGPGEIITHGEDGWLVPPGNSIGLADAMLRLLNDQPLRERLARNGKARAQDFSADRVAERYADVFRGMLSAKTWAY